jgi:hypothetical protein
MSLADDNKFKVIKKSIQKIPVPKNLADIRLLEGKFNCDFPMQKLKLSASISQYVKDAQKLYKELCESINVTTNTMLLLSDAFAKTTDVLKDLVLIHTEIEVSVDNKSIVCRVGEFVQQFEGYSWWYRRIICKTSWID